MAGLMTAFRGYRGKAAGYELADGQVLELAFGARQVAFWVTLDLLRGLPARVVADWLAQDRGRVGALRDAASDWDMTGAGLAAVLRGEMPQVPDAGAPGRERAAGPLGRALDRFLNSLRGQQRAGAAGGGPAAGSAVPGGDLAGAAGPAGPAQEAGTVMELFAGAGGLLTAFGEAGFRHVLAVENDPAAVGTLLANGAVSYDPADPGRQAVRQDGRLQVYPGDISGFDFGPWAGKVDVVSGGVPCQPWSQAGRKRGWDDERNMWPQFIRAVAVVGPKVAVAENVPYLLAPEFRRDVGYILRWLQAPMVAPLDGESQPDHDRRLRAALREPPLAGTAV